jgi:hypothetical protein
MTSASQNSAAGPPGGAGPRRRPALRALLTLAFLIPTAVLFTQVWTDTSNDIAYARTERLGAEYLGSLRRVATAVTDNASAVVAVRPVGAEALDAAVSAMSVVDARLGPDLRTSERWAGLRAKIESLPKTAEPADAMAAYGEATDLLEALFDEVRDESGMIRDPGPDTYFLQDGATQELPEAIVAASHLADVLTANLRLPPDQRAAQAGAETVARAGALGPAGDLSDDVRDAVDASQSRTLGEALLSRLDRFRRGIDALTAMSTLTRGANPLTVEQVAAARTEVQTAAADLAGTVLSELDGLIKTRLDRLADRRLVAVGAAALALLLALAPMLAGALVTRARGRRTAASGKGARGRGPREGGPPAQPPAPPPYGGDDRLEREWARASR